MRGNSGDANFAACGITKCSVQFWWRFCSRIIVISVKSGPAANITYFKVSSYNEPFYSRSPASHGRWPQISNLPRFQTRGSTANYLEFPTMCTTPALTRYGITKSFGRRFCGVSVFKVPGQYKEVYCQIVILPRFLLSAPENCVIVA
jgi:hypothetical protein